MSAEKNTFRDKHYGVDGSLMGVFPDRKNRAIKCVYCVCTEARKIEMKLSFSLFIL